MMKTAIAIMKSGRSFAEASAITGIPVDEIMKEWELIKRNQKQEQLCHQSNVEHAEEM